MKKTGRSASSNNYLQLLFVFGAFSLMAMASYFFIGRILQSHLLSGANELLFSAEANVKAGLSEAETTLLNSYYIVQNMVEQNASTEEIFDYLAVTTDLMQKRNQGLIGYYGIYGYINGKFYNSYGLYPGDDFIPQTRPWYQTAVRNGSVVAYTAPYKDWRTGDTIVSTVRMIDTSSGDIVGILAIDINVNWVVKYVGSLALAADGYGMLLSQNLTIMAYPDNEFIGRQLQDLGGSYLEVARTLRSGGEVYAKRIKDSDGSSIIVFFERIFNNWYVGIATPYSQFYKDLHISAQILAVLGLVLALSLCFILLRLSEARVRADKESRLKSSFLANMSHEIRTPMNAITGMAELLLQGNLSDEARSHVLDIKQAGRNLIAIINDILDFSKIEAGKLEIIPVKYSLSSLVNNTVSIIRIRLIEKKIRFYTNIDGNIPNSLIGDEVRLRQILLNLLSNAVKFTEKGHISMSIMKEPGRHADESIRLKITVTDTGKGIKPEDQVKLFDDFTRIDTKKNRSIEGTGLGLAITKRLCAAMGGEISVESKYGSGTIFTVIIPQSIGSDVPYAAVTEPERKKVLVYESRVVYAESICWSLENMGVPHTMVANIEEFSAAVMREEWFYIFFGYGLYEIIKPIMDKPDSAFPGRKPSMALMVEWGTEAHIPNASFLFLPVQSLSIANILNGMADNKDYIDNPENTSTIKFTFSNTRLLVVDDIPTNLKVSEGLLAPYGVTVDTCLGGMEAIELVKCHDYDIVFMDHMMPDMDGIEAAAVIRAWEKKMERPEGVPIIALTANAVSGMKEMFIQKGFNDFLDKPIDVSKLDKMLNKWIPKEKRKNELSTSTDCGQLSPVPAPQSSLPVIPGINMQRGISMTGGTESGYRNVLNIFLKDLENRLPLFQTSPEQDTLPAFITQVHALKSASASIGAEEVSTQAAALETAGRMGDLEFIGKQLPAFAEQLAELGKGIRIWKSTTEYNDPKKLAVAGKLDYATAMSLLRELAEALQLLEMEKIDLLLEELKQGSPDLTTRETLDQISGEVLMAEYEKAGEILDGLLAGMNPET